MMSERMESNEKKKFKGHGDLKHQKAFYKQLSGTHAQHS